MENMLSNKTVSFTELQDPAKVLAHAGNTPVAILNRNKAVGYFIPLSAVKQVNFEKASSEQLQNILKESNEEIKPVLDYLKDK